jgi:hypothetical protein
MALDITVKDTNGAVLSGVRGKGFDVHNTLVFDAVTAPDGKIPTQELIQYTQSGLTQTYHTPHTLHVTANHPTASRQVTVDGAKAIAISLPPASW